MKLSRSLLSLGALLGVAGSSLAVGTFVPLKNQPPINPANHLLLTDGTVICQDLESNNWWKLTPDKFGNYVNGTWSKIASMSSNYGPLWYASAVLPDGKVFIMGGEYNLGGPGVWTNQGALYDPVANKWSSITAPSGWSNIGDAQCVILPSGRLLLANPFNTQMAAFNESTLDFTPVAATGKTDAFDEEGWTLLPDGSILTVDAINTPAAERYIPSSDTTGKWVSAGSTPNSLADKSSAELGPMVLRYDGTVLATGATQYNAVYTPPTTATGTGTWKAAPNFPTAGGGQLEIADGPCCLLPNGKVLMAASPGVFATGTTFMEFDGTKFTTTPSTANAAGDSCFQNLMLLLPSGQVMVTDFNDVEIYTPDGAPSPSWAPTITSVGQNLLPGSINNVLMGTQLNGLSFGCAYGDDNQTSTNFPTIRITNMASGHVVYCRTHNHSTMAIATGNKVVSTMFDIPATVETGLSTIQVVTNGIASKPLVTLLHGFTAAAVAKLEGLSSFGTVADTYENDTASFDVNSIGEAGFGQVASAVVTFQPPAPLRPVQTAQFNLVTSGALGVTQTAFMWNWATNRWDFITKQSLTSSYSSGMVSLTGAQYATYANSSGQLKLLLRSVFPEHLTSMPPAFKFRINMVQMGRS